MKVLGISGSMRKDGNTADLVNVILERCQGEGIKTEFISLSGKKINPCLGCEKCKTEKQVQPDLSREMARNIQESTRRMEKSGPGANVSSASTTTHRNRFNV